MTSENTLRTYKSAMIRLKEGALRVADASARPPVVADLFRALAIRSTVVAQQSTNVEINALRYHVKILTETNAPRIMNWSPDIQPEPWMTVISQKEWQNFLEHLGCSKKEIGAMGHHIIGEIKEIRALTGSIETEGEIAAMIVGGRKSSGARASIKDTRPIMRRDITTIEMLLSRHDPHNAIQSAREGQALCASGLARVFSSTIWATGMRPAEIYRAVLLVPRPDHPIDADIQEMIRSNPREAIVRRIMIPAEKLPRTPIESLGAAVDNATRQSGAPALLVIRSAKQANANKETRTEIRIQVLEDIPVSIMNMLAEATQLRHMKIPHERQHYIRGAVNRRLKDLAANEALLSDLNMTLYAFRHAFATRVKKLHGIHEAASLLGHTSVKSVYRYGKRRDMVSRGGNAGWVPLADPVHAEMLRASWEAGQARQPEMIMSFEE